MEFQQGISNKNDDKMMIQQRKKRKKKAKRGETVKLGRTGGRAVADHSYIKFFIFFIFFMMTK